MICIRYTRSTVEGCFRRGGGGGNLWIRFVCIFLFRSQICVEKKCLFVCFQMTLFGENLCMPNKDICILWKRRLLGRLRSNRCLVARWFTNWNAKKRIFVVSEFWNPTRRNKANCWRQFAKWSCSPSSWCSFLSQLWLTISLKKFGATWSVISNFEIESLQFFCFLFFIKWRNVRSTFLSIFFLARIQKMSLTWWLEEYQQIHLWKNVCVVLRIQTLFYRTSVSLF